jgi:outer membrane protein
MMRRLCGILVAFGLAFGAPAAASAETLADALISAYRASNLIDQNQAVLRAADEGVAQAVSALRPVIEYTARSNIRRAKTGSFILPGNIVGSISQSQSLELSATMTLYDFGRGDLGVQTARETVMATRQALVSIEQDVLLDAVSAFVDVRLQIETLALRQSNVRLITQELRATQDRFDVGEATRTDVALAEAVLASAQAGEQAAHGAVDLARERFKAAVGHYPGALSGLPASPRTPKSLEEARAIALRTHPGILQIQHQVKAADLQIELAKANFQPTISGGAFLTENWTEFRESGGVFGNPDSESLSLQFNQQIYSGGRKASILRESIAGQERARAGLHQTGVIVSESVGRAWSNISVSSANIQSSVKQVRAAQAAFDGVKEEAELGARTTLDVLDAEQNLLDARFSKLQAEANLYVGVYQLLSTMGLLTVDHLNLGVPTYDVEAYYDAVKKAPAHSAQGEALDRILKTIGN